MKRFGIIGTTALFLVLGTNVPTFAQEHQEDAKPAQHEEQAKPAAKEAPARQEAPAKQEAAPRQTAMAQPAKQEAQPKPARQETAAKPAQEQPQVKAARQDTAAKPAQEKPQAKAESQEKQAKPEQAKSAKPENTAVKQEARSSPAGQRQPQRTAAQERTQRAVPALRLSASSSSRIPDGRFRSNFGQEHVFRIGTPRMVGGYSRFQYGGYWFGFVQPWPVDWYYTDDVYVDFIDGGYYLCNPYYPGVRVAINVVL